MNIGVIIGLIIYLSGVIACFVYAIKGGVAWYEAILPSLCSWVGLFLMWGMNHY